MFCSSSGTQCHIVSHFCHSCAKNLQDERACLSSENDPEVNEDSVITEYFHSGYPYNTIVDLLKKRGIVMHLRTLN